MLGLAISLRLCDGFMFLLVGLMPGLCSAVFGLFVSYLRSDFTISSTVITWIAYYCLLFAGDAVFAELNEGLQADVAGVVCFFYPFNLFLVVAGGVS